MSDEHVDWDALLERRLIESRERQRDEAQAAEPPPGPQAAEQVLEKLRTAAENGELGQAAPPAETEAESAGPTEEPSARVAEDFRVEMPPMHVPPPPPVRPAPARRPSTRRVPPIVYMVPPRHGGEHRHGGLGRLKQVAFWVLLLAMLLLGMVLTFWPDALRRLLGAVEQPSTSTPPPVAPPPQERREFPAPPADAGTAKPPAATPPERQKAPPVKDAPTRVPLPKDNPPPPDPAPPAGEARPAPTPDRGKTPPEPAPAPGNGGKPAPKGPLDGPDASELKPPAPPEAPEPPAPPTDGDLPGE